MDWSFLTALGDMKMFPAYGLLAAVAVLVYTGRLVPSRAVVREIERVIADRDANLAAKDAELARTVAAYDAGIARTATAHDAEVTRARQAETEWREAWRESQDIAAEVRSQNRDLVDSLYFVRKVVGSLPGITEGGDKT